MEKVHIGRIIKEQVKLNKLTARIFGSRISLTEDSIYKLYKRESIDTNQLKLISEVLNYDFFQHYTPRIDRCKELDNENAALKRENSLLQELVESLKGNISKGK